MSAYSVPTDPTDTTWRPPMRPILEKQLEKKYVKALRTKQRTNKYNHHIA